MNIIGLFQNIGETYV